MALPEFFDELMTSERLRVYPRIFLSMYLLAIFSWVIMADGVFDIRGQPLGTDFTSFYAAAQLALSGHAPLAYDFTAQFAAEKAALGHELVSFYPFPYPPTFMLLMMPLGKLPYLAALFTWQSLSLLFFVLMIKRLAGRSEVIMLTLAFPAVFVTVGHGQNSFLTAGLIAGALYFLDSRPVVSGLLIGMLTFKPHLGILIPLVLIVSGRWRVCVYAIFTSGLFAALSLLFLGSETWIAFFSSTGKAATILNEGMVSFYKMQSLYASLRGMGLNSGVSYVLHGVFALGTAAVVLWVWGRQDDFKLKAAALGIGALMVTPHLLDYDLAILAIPISCVTIYGLVNGFRPGLISLLYLAWLLPIIVRPLNLFVTVPWTPILLSALLYQVVRLCIDHNTCRS